MAVSLIYLVHMAVVLQVFSTHGCSVHGFRAHTFSKHGCSVTYRDCHWNARSTAGGVFLNTVNCIPEHTALHSTS